MADTKVDKPFAPDELLNRVEALLASEPKEGA